MLEWIVGLGCSVIVAGAAFAKKSLSLSGALAAVVVGTLLYAAGNAAWFGTLLVFFITSTLLSKWKHRQKASVEANYAKSGRRDAGQVMANGGLAAVMCLGNLLWPSPFWWAAFVGIMATVNADTWATEIGGLSHSQPRSIVSGRKVPAGTSGGVTRLGLTASAAGGLLIGASAWVLSGGELNPANVPANGAQDPGAAYSLWSLLVLGGIGGTIGSLVDSWLGAVCQVMYRCHICGRDLEKNSHCDTAAQHIRGFKWMTNDLVNLTSSVIGGACSIGLYTWLI
ncbi:DUF92 domain-containing protein [Paenibacillus rigui]|uniref:DUF92 domain-containing protein n=1 Tax=Paenibacillus rigui TaxID=554312 RepID=A0A229ULI8_9BACL|nr:DUF92 domain-containing protein [Paenibacillus rigui]OXM84155.1 hypothetical protein CF651_22220 [Paenibacillus rigui]